MSEVITLPALGSIPGIPGEHPPGVYEVDWDARTLTPVVAPVPAPEAVAPEPRTPVQPEQSV